MSGFEENSRCVNKGHRPRASAENFHGCRAVRTKSVLTAKSKRFSEIREVYKSSCKDLKHFIESQSGLQIIYHHQMLQSTKLFIFAILQKKLAIQYVNRNQFI